MSAVEIGYWVWCGLILVACGASRFVLGPRWREFRTLISYFALFLIWVGCSFAVAVEGGPLWVVAPVSALALAALWLTHRSVRVWADEKETDLRREAGSADGPAE